MCFLIRYDEIQCGSSRTEEEVNATPPKRKNERQNPNDHTLYLTVGSSRSPAVHNNTYHSYLCIEAGFEVRLLVEKNPARSDSNIQAKQANCQ